MKIVIWCANLISVGGGARLLSNLLPAMARQAGIERVRLVISAETQFRDRLNGISYPNMEIAYFSGSIQSAEGQDLLQDTHVVYFFWPHGPEYVPMGLPTICTFHDTTVLDYVPPFLSGSVVMHVWRAAKEWLDNMTSIVVSSHHVKGRLIQHFGPSCEAATVIEHAIVPAPTLAAGELSPGAAARIPQQYILYPSNISPHKNHYNLLLAYARFRETYPIPLILFGHNTELLRSVPPLWPDQMYIPTLVSLIRRTGLKLDEHIYPLGFVPDNDVIPLVGQAQALIMPSLSEGGGSYPVEEALKLGVPVLCSDIPVMREHLSRHSAEVVWFDPESPDAITRALEQLFGNYAHYKASAMGGIHDSSETWNDIALKYILVFHRAYQKYHRL